MPKPAIQVDGLKELQREVRRIKDSELSKQLRDTNRRLADRIVAKALPSVPVRTGRLKSSVKALGRASGAVGKAGGARVPYAPAIHWGWPSRNIAGRPFLKDAADGIEDEAVREYEKDINRVFDAMRGR